MSKKNSWNIGVILGALVISIFLVASCELNASQESTVGSAAIRAAHDIPKQSVQKPTSFTATIELVQSEEPNTFPVGQGKSQSNRLRTTNEILEGSVVKSSWSALEGAVVTMSNFTNFRLDWLSEHGFFEISGTNHSSVKITMENGEVVTLKANGSIDGYFPTSAELTMNWSSIESGISMRGNLTGTFSWLPSPPSGVIILSGYYK